MMTMMMMNDDDDCGGGNRHHDYDDEATHLLLQRPTVKSRNLLASTDGQRGVNMRNLWSWKVPTPL